MDMLVEAPRRMDELIDTLELAARRPAKQRVVKISHILDQVCSEAFERGLSPVSLTRLVDLTTLPNELDQGSINSLIRHLYPVDKVPDEIVINVVSSLGHGRAKPSYGTQASLLRWLVMIYDVLENSKVLSQLYSVLFNILDTVAIRPQLCHVLSLITRRRHVRPFRIQALMELIRQAGNEPPLVGLMRVFKDYYPDVIIGNTTSGRASAFTHPNPEWRQRLGEIQEAHSRETRDQVPLEERSFRVSRKSKSAKSRKSTIIPEVYTSHAQESSVTLEEIEDVHDFVYQLEKIEPPNQMIAVLGDPLLQKYLQLKNSENNSKRVDNWLFAFFEDHLAEETQSSETHILEVLKALLEYTHSTKKLPAACLVYLKSMIPSWNGVQGRDEILGLLAYTPISSFEELYSSVFQPLEEALIQDSAISSKTALLDFYTNLHDQWTTTMLSLPSPTTEVAAPLTSLMNHASSLALTILQTSLSIPVISCVLRFYESVAFLITLPTLRAFVRINLPPAELVYTLHFTTSLSNLSRLCAILALYKKAFEIAMAPRFHSATEGSTYPKDYVNHFNGFLMDICNCLWRSRAFNSSDPNAMGCLISPNVILALTRYISSLDTSLSFPSIFSASFSPVLCLLAISYLRELEDAAEDEITKRHAGPVTQNSLKQLEREGGISLQWPDYKLGVLQYMENKGAPGVGALMYNSMKHLMAAREATKA